MKEKKDIKDQLKSIIDNIAQKGVYMALVVGILPAFVFAYFGYSFLIAPGIEANKAAEAEVAKLETEVLRGKAVEQSEGAFRAEFKKVVELFYDSLPLLPKETEISNVLQGVQSVASRYNVELTGLESVKIGQKTANADKLYEREIPATVVGSYTDVMQFFLDLSKQTRILIVRDYAVASADGKKQRTRPRYVKVDFTLLAYHTPPTAEFPTVTMPGLEIPQNAPQIAVTRTDSATASADSEKEQKESSK